MTAQLIAAAYGRPVVTGADVDRLSAEIHADNVAAGWWSDLATGARIERNVGELLMLVVTEVWEGTIGLSQRLMDDKLPHREMIEVELADAAIRILDIGGGLNLELGRWFEDEETVIQPLRKALASLHSPSEYLLQIIGCVSETMEHHRKGRTNLMSRALAMALHAIFATADLFDLDVIGAMAEKRAFNKTRPDHQREARLADDGKKC